MSAIGTVVVTHPKCIEHAPSEGYLENHKRLEVLCGDEGVLRTEEFHGLHWSHGSEASMGDIQKVHDYGYCGVANTGSPKPRLRRRTDDGRPD